MYCTNRAKIIPLPGVSFNMANNAQSENMLINFLNELGYIETPDFLGDLQSGSQKNELEKFLLEMGYVE